MLRYQNLNRASLWLFFIIAYIFCVSLYAQEEVSDSLNNHFYFVQITDTHVGTENNLEFTQKIVEQINNLPMHIQCIVHTGDIVNYGMEDTIAVSNAIFALEKLEAPLLLIPGNHDIYRNNLNSTKDAYIKRFGPLITENEFGKIVFIGLYSNPLARSFSVEDFDPLSELEEALQRAEGRPIVVFHHIPSVEDFYLNKMHSGWKKDIRSSWEEVLNAYNVIAVLAGHFHRDEHYWLGEVPLYISASVTDHWGRQPSFRIFEYINGRLNYRTQYLER